MTLHRSKITTGTRRYRGTNTHQERQIERMTISVRVEGAEKGSEPVQKARLGHALLDRVELEVADLVGGLGVGLKELRLAHPAGSQAQ